MNRKIVAILIWLITIGNTLANNQTLNPKSNDTKGLVGSIVDSNDGTTLIGASIYVEELGTGVLSDLDGRFHLAVEAADYSIKVRYMGYKTQVIQLKKADFESSEYIIRLEPESEPLADVAVVAKARLNSEVAMLQNSKRALTISDGISAQQIKRSSDNNASELIKRIPGITVMDGKFVMVRGLNQRYNNVWMNGASVPSSEADSRVFSFDQVPSSQIDNLIIVKSPAAEYPADFAGGCVQIKTKEIPEGEALSIGIKGGYKQGTHGKAFWYNKGSSTDFLGFDGGLRQLSKEFPAALDNENLALVDELSKNGFNKDWSLREQKPLADLSLAGSYNKLYHLDDGKRIGLLSSISLSHGYRTLDKMLNNRYAYWNTQEDKAEYLNKYTDDQYSISSHLSALLNLSLQNLSGNNYSIKNSLNILGLNKYTMREGFQNQSQLYWQKKHEYFYNSRLIYTGQLLGDWYLNKAKEGKLSAIVGYSYANNDRPDRRMIELSQNDNESDPNYGLMSFDSNDISREFSYLAEHIVTGKADYQQELMVGEEKKGTIKGGVNAEMRSRSFDNRQFYYHLNPQLPNSFKYLDPASEALTEANLGIDKLYINELLRKDNSYQAASYLGAAYLAANIPVGKWDLYGGIRLEAMQMQLSNYSQAGDNYLTNIEKHNDFGLYPSLNSTYRISDEHQLRVSYGMSINRAEFRELSKMVYFDFDLFSYVKGNPSLKPSKIHNLDLRYEFYPSRAELISLSAFYKHFIDPIEWSYLESSGLYYYRYENALKANSYGVEAEIRKQLNSIGLPHFTLVCNAAWIKSLVSFDEESLEEDRPMQGQSPYIINASLFYQHPDKKITASILFNRIGKRIVGVGRVDKSGSGSINNEVPDSYEMPRNALDLSLSYQFTKQLELKLTANNILNSKVQYKQFPRYTDSEGKTQQRNQTTKEYKLGQNIDLSLTYKL